MTDLELAIQWSESLCFNLSKQEERGLAELIAGVRRETREATIRECADVVGGLAADASSSRAFDQFHLAVKRVLALLTPPSAPDEIRCAVCGVNAGAPCAPDNHRFVPRVVDEPKCRVCGRLRPCVGVTCCGGAPEDDHPFEPEEPGHG